jgi:hypothetical protein
MDDMLLDFLKGFRENRCAGLLLQAVELKKYNQLNLGKRLNFEVQPRCIL